MCVERLGCACLWRDRRYVEGETFVCLWKVKQVCVCRERLGLWRETRVWVFVYVGNVCVCVWVCRDWVVGVEGEKEVGRNRVSVCVCVCVYEGRDEKVRGADQGVWRNL